MTWDSTLIDREALAGLGRVDRIRPERATYRARCGNCGHEAVRSNLSPALCPQCRAPYIERNDS